MVEITNDYLNSLSDEKLREFADMVCGAVFEPLTPRGVIYTKIVNCALAIQDGH